MPKADASLEERGGRPALRFERLLPHPPGRVWKALTDPAELTAWHPSPFELEPRVGGIVRYASGDAWPDFPDGEVIEYEPPRRLGYTWGGEDTLLWELRPDPEGCLLILIHGFDDGLKAARDAAGWDLCLLALEDSLAGEAADRDHVGDAGRPPSGWSELNDAYQRKFGISPARATPPPKRR